MREERKRKSLYANRREELYPESLLRKEYAKPQGRRSPAPAAAPKPAPRTSRRPKP